MTGIAESAGAAEQGAAPLPLAGWTVAVTAARRHDELENLLERRGARVVSAPAIRIVPLADDSELLAATRRCLADPPDVVVATTGIGFRGWNETADGWGLGEQLRAVFARSRLLARGPKARGAIRAVGLTEAWSPPSEATAEVLEYLLGQGVSGLRIAVQLHGEPLTEFRQALTAAGAQVLEVPVYRWTLPEDVTPVHRLVEAIVGRQVDAVTFTSAPAVSSLLQVATEDGVCDDLIAALRTDVLPVCVGSITAAPLVRLGVECPQPERGRLGALVRCVTQELPARRSIVVRAAGRVLEIRGQAVVLDGRFVPLPPAPLAVLRALATHPGLVVSREQLAAALAAPGATATRDDHAVEMAVTRLRQGLDTDGRNAKRLVQTVVKRGYRLAEA
ncbi:MAG TPA: uroporphyrinogen-III synthase [Mycobacteriales bacterium]|nr:uroporphyrinogen-III synthase [Mycobacteriales bacterium]